MQEGIFMDKDHVGLDSLIEVKSSQLTPNTYSPT